MELRLIRDQDFDLGYLDLIKQLFPEFKPLTFEGFRKILRTISKHNGHIYVIYDSEKQKIVATGKIMIEQKSHGPRMGIIQDVVTDQEYQNQGLGKQIIDQLIKVAENFYCYKVILNSNAENIGFYQKCQFETKGTEMTRYLHSDF